MNSLPTELKQNGMDVTFVTSKSVSIFPPPCDGGKTDQCNIYWCRIVGDVHCIRPVPVRKNGKRCKPFLSAFAYLKQALMWADVKEHTSVYIHPTKES